MYHLHKTSKKKLEEKPEVGSETSEQKQTNKTNEHGGSEMVLDEGVGHNVVAGIWNTSGQQDCRRWTCYEEPSAAEKYGKKTR